MKTACPKCGSGKTNTHGRYLHCNDCKGYTLKKNVEQGETQNAEYGRDFINVVCTSRRMMTEHDIIEHFQIDTNIWELESYQVGTSEGYRKDRKVNWKVRGGVVESGDVSDSGKMLVVPLFNIKAKFIKRTIAIANNETVQDLIKKAKKYAPKYKKIVYKKQKDGVLYEIEMPDLQLGRMVQSSETGRELTPDISVETARRAIYQLLGYSKIFPVEKIVFPVGHDFFDSNNADNKTAHGTPQRDDPRWQRTFRLGRDLIIEIVESMSTIAPVDVPVIVGNHDEERMFYLGDTLESWFHRNPNVTIDNTDKKRKYRLYGECLLGFTHGYWEPLKNLPHLMAVEEKRKWGSSTFREWHVGDKHHQDITVTKPSEEHPGTVVRIIRSLASPSVWEYDKGHIGSICAAESFIWHPQKGMIAQFTAG